MKTPVAAKFFTQGISISLLLLSIFFSIQTNAQDLLIFPKRVVFDGSKRTQELNLANSGKDTAKYLISVVQIKMHEDGKFETITEPDPGQNFADKHFRIFPRSVLLGPGEAQTVKIQLTNTTGMQPGEYRSHLYFRAEKEKKPLGEEEEKKDSGKISVNITAVFGITIPVIIRSGVTHVDIKMSEVRFAMEKDTIPTVHMTFNRTGNVSTYGDIAVEHISDDGKTVTPVGIVTGISVYTPTLSRKAQLGLNNNKNINYNTGKLRVTYTDQNSKELLAQTEIKLKTSLASSGK